MKNLRDYHDLYLKTDVLLLADVFESFRVVTMNSYGLDPLHYLTAPGLSWDAMLKMTKVELELFTEPEQLLFIEQGIRGGVSMISNRHSKANNAYLPDFDPEEETKYIVYLDANNLYGWSMSQPLPIRNFRFLPKDEIENFNLKNLSDYDDKGYILEVDLEYPDHLHDLHNDYPLAPEHYSVPGDMLSPAAKELLAKFNRKVPKMGQKKLIPTLLRKNKYIVHYRNLQYYLEKGMKLCGIHRILEFDQEAWLAPYINFNTEKRKLAKSSFEKDLWKLFSNSIFGKTMENMRQRKDIRIVTDPYRAKCWVARPTFNSFKIVNEDMTIVKLDKTSVYWNRPSYAGMVILDLSKLHMYRFHYDHVLKKYGGNAKLLFTDTDSLTYELKTADVYKDMRENLDLYDTSDYPHTHFLHDSTNAKVLGKFKDECAGKPPLEFVGLRSKMYSILLSDNLTKNAVKGIKKSFVRKHIRHEQFQNCLTFGEKTKASFFSIRSFNQQLQTVRVEKDALSPFDDKRYLTSEGTDTISYGHWRIRPDVSPEEKKRLGEQSCKIGYMRSYISKS